MKEENSTKSSFQVFTVLLQLWASEAKNVSCMAFLSPLLSTAATLVIATQT